MAEWDLCKWYTPQKANLNQLTFADLNVMA